MMTRIDGSSCARASINMARKGSSTGRHEDPAHDIENRHLLPGRRLAHMDPAARTARGVIQWPEQGRLFLNELESFLLVPDMIAGGQAVNAQIEHLLSHLRRDTEPTGGVLGVGDHEINPGAGPPSFPGGGPACGVPVLPTTSPMKRIRTFSSGSQRA